MTSRELQSILKQRPFEPIRIFFPEGETRDVRHREVVWAAGQTIFFGSGEQVGGDYFIDDFTAAYGINMIKKVEKLTGARESASQNGN